MTLKKTVLFCVAILFFADRISAQDEFKIFLEFLPDSVTQDEAFTINLVVTHPNPEEIYVRPPGFNDAFRMERMRTEVRLVSDITRNSEQYTVFEFLLIPDKAGLQEIGSFEVEVLGKTKGSNPMTVYVQASEENFNARLVWLGQNGRRAAADSVSIGEAYETALRIISWENNRPYPKTFTAPIDAPENAIVEELPLSKNDRDTGIVLRLRIVPLDGKTVTINTKSIEYEKSWIEIPALTINVLPAAVKFTGPELRESSIAEDKYAVPVRRVGQVSFPGMMDDNKKIIAVFRRGADECIAWAERLWREEKYAAALAVLRNGEMTLSASSAVRRARAACESALYLPSGVNEPWLPRSPMLIVLIVSAAAFVILFFVRKKIFTPASLLWVVLFVFLFDLSALSFSYSLGKNRAVIKYCAAYPIPEDDVKVESFFMEGETVNIRSKSGSWFYVESAEIGSLKKSGWIKNENAVILAGDNQQLSIDSD
jgi:hypothetical protein